MMHPPRTTQPDVHCLILVQSPDTVQSERASAGDCTAVTRGLHEVWACAVQAKHPRTQSYDFSVAHSVRQHPTGKAKLLQSDATDDTALGCNDLRWLKHLPMMPHLPWRRSARTTIVDESGPRPKCAGQVGPHTCRVDARLQWHPTAFRPAGVLTPCIRTGSGGVRRGPQDLGGSVPGESVGGQRACFLQRRGEGGE